MLAQERTKRWGGREQLQKVREISRGDGSDGFETGACSFVGDSSFDGQPVEMSAYWYDVYIWRCSDYKMGSAFQDSL